MAIYLEDYKDLISTLATVATIAQFLTGSKICRDFIRKARLVQMYCSYFWTHVSVRKALTNLITREI